MDEESEVPDENDDIDLDEPDSSVIRDLRGKAKRVDAAEAETKALRTELAIAKAGLPDLSEARQKALLAAHEGDMTPEALRKTAVDLGFAPADTEPETPAVTAPEQAALGAMQEATAAGEAVEAHPKTIEDGMREAAAKGEAALDAFLTSNGFTIHAQD